ncbi:hypothetical protein BDD12DRAFT_899808 [Trichophaea hybrida]|nr:hypothetical protein BDD12DRAFT_899808 [Trichophaea hybrida]
MTSSQITVNKKNKGKKNASAPAPPTKKIVEGEGSRTAARDGLHPGSTVPASSSSAPPKPATVSRRGLPFGERLYDSDCGSDNDAPCGQSDDDVDSNDFGSVCSDNEHFHADENDMKMDPVGVITEYVEETLQQAKNFFERQSKNHDELSARAATLEAKVASWERLRVAQTADAKDLRQRVDDLEGRNRMLETTVETQLVEVKKAKQEKELAAATQVVTPPTTPRKDVAIRPASPKTPSRAATPLAQQVLKRNMAKRKERSQSEAMEVDCDDNLNENTAPATGRPAMAPRQSSPTPSLMHSRHATGVDKGKEKDKGERDQQCEARKPRNRKEEGGSWRSRRNPKENKEDAGRQEVRRRWRPIGPCTKVNDGRGVTTVWDTRDGRYESWRPHKREPRQQRGGGERR